MLFSEFLFDDHIRSRLVKDIRYFRDNKHKLDNRYPYARAVKFNSGIKALGVENGMTYLDHFRRLITTIGNVLGYVRMVRSSGLHQCYKSIQFVPDVEDVPTFADKAEEDGLSGQTRDASKNLDSVLSNLISSFGEDTDYLHALVNVFRKVSKSQDYGHLKNFVAIIPPLCLNFVEHLMQLKEQVSKKGGRSEASFTDDGFALGLAFMLKVLDQMDNFDAYHWWEEVDNEMKKSQKDIEKTKMRRESSAAETYTLSIRQLSALKKEWDLLYFSFEASRVFFRDVQQEQEQENKNEQKEEPATEVSPEQNQTQPQQQPTETKQSLPQIEAQPAPPQPTLNPEPQPPPQPQPAEEDDGFTSDEEEAEEPPAQPVVEQNQTEEDEWSSEEHEGPMLAIMAPPPFNPEN